MSADFQENWYKRYFTGVTHQRHNFKNCIINKNKVCRDNYSLRPGRSGDRIPVGARFSALVQTGPWAHPASYAI